jgi:iron(III) transport system permease protein
VRRGPHPHECLLATGAAVIAALVVAPGLAVVWSLTSPSREVWTHLASSVLPATLVETSALVAGVGVLTAGLGVSFGWLVAVCDFPGRRAFEWALVLPLAVPAYISGYVYLALLDFTGPVQTWLRAVAGADVRLPEVRSLPGAIIVLALVFYPYVYLLARAAFQTLGRQPVEVARGLGRSPFRAWWSATLPAARPAIVAGLALAVLETLADFGTVTLFGLQTMTVSIYRVWFGMFDREAATELSAVLLLAALAVLAVEQRARGRARFTQAFGDGQRRRRDRLSGPPAWLATASCALVLSTAFIVPVATLAVWSVSAVGGGHVPLAYLHLVRNTVVASGLAAVLAVGAGLWLVGALRAAPSALVRLAGRVAGVGYGLPGVMVAAGVLSLLSPIDDALYRVVRTQFGIELGFVLQGTLVALLMAYLVRFVALALMPLEAGIAAISPSLAESARSLGATPGRVLRAIDLPLLRGPLAAAATLVFVDVMKELPATFLMRPLGFDTLAIDVWRRTSEGLWIEAAVPALTIVGVGLAPVIWLTHASGRRDPATI